jgi:hypothetical protein
VAAGRHGAGVLSHGGGTRTGGGRGCTSGPTSSEERPIGIVIAELTPAAVHAYPHRLPLETWIGLHFLVGGPSTPSTSICTSEPDAKTTNVVGPTGEERESALELRAADTIFTQHAAYARSTSHTVGMHSPASHCSICTSDSALRSKQS